MKGQYCEKIEELKDVWNSIDGEQLNMMSLLLEMMGDKGSIGQNEIGEDFELPFDRVYLTGDCGNF